MPVKKSIRTKKPARANFMRAGAAQIAWWTSTPVVAGAAIGLFVAAILVAVYQSPSTADAHRQSKATVSAPEPASEPAATPEAAAAVPQGPEAPAATEVKPAPVTITGCLERSDATFRLTDTSGENAPRSRSWKSAFLKKRSATIDVVGPAKRLESHVGERVSMTGTLVDREMHVASMHRVAPSCSAPSAPKVKA